MTVESPKFIPDKVTGDLREHDILITQPFPQREIITAIECRDLSRPVTVDQIESFHTKCEDTGINKRVIVSSKGFYNAARLKAERYGIDCLTFAQVENVDWLGQTEMVFRERKVRHTEMKIGAPMTMQGKNSRLFLSITDGPDEDTGVRAISGEGDQITFEDHPDKLIHRIMKQVPDPTSDLAGSVRYRHLESRGLLFPVSGTPVPNDMQTGGIWDVLPTLDDMPEGFVFVPDEVLTPTPVPSGEASPTADESGALVNVDSVYSAEKSIAPGGTAVFQIGEYSGPCERYLPTTAGYGNS